MKKHSNTRRDVRPEHERPLRFWVPRFGEWLTLNELHYRKMQEQQEKIRPLHHSGERK